MTHPAPDNGGTPLPTGRIVNVRAGRARKLPRPEWDRRPSPTWTSAYIKEEAQGPVALTRMGLDGDEQHDRRVHGGPEMALLAYAAAHYPLWREELGIAEMGPGGFGENLVVEGLDEQTLCVGDVLETPSTRLQVSQPRGPCANISRRWDRQDLLARVTATGRTGWYLRVLREGPIAAGQPIAVIERLAPDWTVARVLRLRLNPAGDPDAVARLAECAELSGEWRAKFARLAQAERRP